MEVHFRQDALGYIISMETPFCENHPLRKRHKSSYLLGVFMRLFLKEFNDILSTTLILYLKVTHTIFLSVHKSISRSL